MSVITIHVTLRLILLIVQCVIFIKYCGLWRRPKYIQVHFDNFLPNFLIILFCVCVCVQKETHKSLLYKDNTFMKNDLN